MRRYRVTTCASPSLIAKEAQLGAIEAPGSKIQIPNKSEYPNLKPTRQDAFCFGHWNLRFAWNLELGFWDFGLVPFRTAVCCAVEERRGRFRVALATREAFNKRLFFGKKLLSLELRCFGFGVFQVRSSS